MRRHPLSRCLTSRISIQEMGRMRNAQLSVPMQASHEPRRTSRRGTGPCASDGRPMSHDVVLAETRGPVGLVTLNRPQKLNALDYALIDRLMAVLDSIEADEDVRAVILTGAGERAF